MATRKLQPFPFAISVGTDIVSVGRIWSLTHRQSVQRFVDKIMTHEEKEHFYKRFVQSSLEEASQIEHNEVTRHLAGSSHQQAAKEAVIKACNWRRLLLRDVQILPRKASDGVYGVILDKTEDQHHTDGTVTHVDEPLNGQIVQVSISHEQDYATAVCIAAAEPVEGDVGGEAAARML